MAMVFLAMDLLTFYIGFELALIPLFALVAGWGTDRKESFAAARRFVLFTLAGSIPMVLGLLALASLRGGDAWTWDFVGLSAAANAPADPAVGRGSEACLASSDLPRLPSSWYCLSGGGCGEDGALWFSSAASADATAGLH
jgi:hypothetical protein